MSDVATSTMILDPETRMFAGTFDDSVGRYPWSGYEPNLANFNRSLIFHAILGPRLCCRIGNILYQSHYYTALVDPDASPLRSLCKAGFIQLQMKGDSINETISLRQKAGTNSTLAFIRQRNWSPSSDTYKIIEDVDKDIQYGVGKIRYNSAFNADFRVIMDRVAGHSYAPFRRIHERWHREFAETERTRSNFEELGKTFFADRREEFVRCMQIVNSVNHYAYGCALKNDFPGVMIETEEISLLNDLTRTPIGPEESIIDVDRYDVLIRKGAFDVIGNNLAIPKAFFHHSTSWTALAQALTPDAENAKYRAIIKHKKNILFHVDKLLHSEEGREQNETIEDLKKHTLAYSQFLFSLVGSRREKKYFMGMEIGIERVATDLSNQGSDVVKDWINKSIDIGMTAAGLPIGSSIPVKYVYRILHSIFTDEANRRLTRIIGSGIAANVAPHAGFPSVKEVGNAFRYPSIKIMETRVPNAPSTLP